MEEPIENGQVSNDSRNLLPASIVVAAAVVMGALIIKEDPISKSAAAVVVQSVEARMVDGGRILPIDTENKMLDELTKDGVIDIVKLPRVTELNLLWAFGLANKNQVFESGPVKAMPYGGLETLASVGGWSVAAGSPMEHLNMHGLATLTVGQQILVEKVAAGTYRPCCNNSTYFPDCNHGMAMLGLLEYLASQGATEDQLWNAAITANMIWFPDQYRTIAEYLKQKGTDLRSLTPQALLGAEYSSASGYGRIAAQVRGGQRQGGSGCDVETGQPVDFPGRQSGSGCGV